MVVDLSFYALFQWLLSATWLVSQTSKHFGFSWHLAISGALSIAIALLWNFTLNRRLTFNDARGGSWFRQFLTYALSNAVAIAVSFTLRLYLPMRVGFFSQHKLAAAVVGIVVATGISFSMSRWIVFARRVDQRSCRPNRRSASPQPWSEVLGPLVGSVFARAAPTPGSPAPAAIRAMAGTIGARIRRSVQKKAWTSVRPITNIGAAIRGHGQSDRRDRPEPQRDPERQGPGNRGPSDRRRDRPRPPAPRSRSGRAGPARPGRNRAGRCPRQPPDLRLSSSDRPGARSCRQFRGSSSPTRRH